MSPSYPYQLYEMAHAALAPARAVSDAASFQFRNPCNPLANMPFGKNVSAGAELFERITRRYGKPTFGLEQDRSRRRRLPPSSKRLSGRSPSAVFCASRVPVSRPVSASRNFCSSRRCPAITQRCYGAPLRRFCPISTSISPIGRTRAWCRSLLGSFDLDDYIVYLREIFAYLGPGVHAIAVCQPSVPLLAAVALMEAERRSPPCRPA